MRKLFLLFFLITAFSYGFAQKGEIKGIITDQESGKALQGVAISAGNQQVLSGEDGSFVIKALPKGNVTLIFSINEYQNLEKVVNNTGGLVNLGKITMKASGEAEESGVSEISLSSMEMEDETKEQNISGLLHSSGDVYTSTAAYTFGQAYYRIRGYDNENQSVYINGIMVNDIENGRASWSEWGGLNDATRNKEIITGLNSSRFSFGNLGGVTNILTRASMQRKQTKLSYSLSNRTYTNRLMFTYSTGLMKNNWAITASGSRRWGDGGYVDGTFYDAWAYFLGVEKKINNQHSIAFTAFGAPTRRGMQGGTVQEVYDLLGDKYYNPNWGYQNGEKRNAKVKEFHEPMFLLNHYWTIDKKSKLTTSLAYSFGKNGTTSLNWYNASDPRPDYYRYLPNYRQDTSATINPFVQANSINDWKTDVNTRQINWGRLYQVNYLNNLEGKQASYIVENNIVDHSQISVNSNYVNELSKYVTLTGGIDFTSYNAEHYKELDDLLGGTYWMDIDQYAERDFQDDTAILQNDLNNPNRKVKEGDKFGYDYFIHHNSGGLWAQSSFTYNKVDFYVSGSLSQTQFWREGKMRNGRFPDNSYGNGEKHDFTNFGIKGGLTYKISGRQFLQANVIYTTRAPYERNAYLSARVRDDVVPNLTSEKIFSGDISYILRLTWLTARLTAYHTQFSDQSEVTSFYHDSLQTFVNFALTKVKKVHQGIEFGAEAKVNSHLSFTAAAGIGNYRYTNHPLAVISVDNGSQEDSYDTVYCKNFYVSGTPQTALSLGLKYNINYWFFDVNANYFDQMYLDFNPLRRTKDAIYMISGDDPLLDEITKQEKLPDAFTLDASIGKSWKIKNYYLNLNFSVTNILDNQDLITGGYEQSRYDYKEHQVDKFPSKYYYAYGRTFFLNLGFRF